MHQRRESSSGVRPIVVEGLAVASGGSSESLPIPPPSPGPGQLVVPSNEQFALIRAEARAAGKLKDLRQTVAAWQAVAEKCDLAFEEVMRLAVFRLEVERDLGAQLAQTLKPGPRRKSSPGVINCDAGLPDGISPNQSASYQKLAAIPDDVFRAYIEKSRADRKLPSSDGARRFASPKKTGTRTPRRKDGACMMNVPAAVLDACVRCLGEIDVLVGKAKVKAATCAAGLSGLTKEARGAVLIVGTDDPAASLREVAKLRESGRIDQGIVVLPRDIDANWWSSLSAGPWSLCLPSERGSPVVAHIGGHVRGFALVFAGLGVVADVQHGVAARR